MRAGHGSEAAAAAAGVVFCVFAVTVMAVIALAAFAYKNIADISRRGDDERAALSYVWTKIKNGGEIGAARVTDFHGLSALRLSENHDGAAYNTLIYNYDGWLRELVAEEGFGFSPEDGERVVKNESLVFELTSDGLIKASTLFGSVFAAPAPGRYYAREGGAAE
jgi:hypothetical protein